MNLKIFPGKLNGTVEAVPSKSGAHRALIAAALSDGETRVVCPQLSKDITATAQCLKAMGAGMEYRDGSFFVQPVKPAAEQAVLDCGESGSTLRFLLPLAAALGIPAQIHMQGRLSERPLSPLWEELEAHGCVLRRGGEAGEILYVSGKLESGAYSIAADVSSQFVTGLLFALSVLPGESTLELTGKVESSGYIEITLRTMEIFGVRPDGAGRRFCFPAAEIPTPEGTAGRYHTPGLVKVEGDWSGGAFWLTAAALGSNVHVTGLSEDSPHKDRAVVSCLEAIRQGNAVIDAADIPDLVPVLAVAAALTPGTTRFINAGRLRIKESDRLRSVSDMLRALGGSCSETEDGLIVEGREMLDGGMADSVNDHRIAMSAAIAATRCREPVIILGAHSAEKSYPGFWRDYEALGGKLSEY